MLFSVTMLNFSQGTTKYHKNENIKHVAPFEVSCAFFLCVDKKFYRLILISENLFQEFMPLSYAFNYVPRFCPLCSTRLAVVSWKQPIWHYRAM